MQVGQIAPHPDAPEHHIVMKAPPGTEDWCGDLHVRLGVNAGGQIGFMSEWYPTEEELALLNAGQPVRTFIVGRDAERIGDLALPPQAVWVRGEDEV